MSRQFNSSILEWLLIVTIGGFLAFWVIKGLFREQRPLSNADIPQETIDWFKGLTDDGSDIGGILGPDDRDPSDWNRYESIDSMHRLEDKFFIIYYSQKDSVVEKEKARICQRYAYEAIPEGQLLMKNYPLPEQLNGRKLPIFLAKTTSDYQSICEQIGHNFPGSGTIGLYCFQYGAGGVYTDGILISPEAWGPAGDDPFTYRDDHEFKKTLWHEMNHFMYFSNWDFTQASKPCLWFTEGLAEYFAGNYSRLSANRDHNKYNLTDNLPSGNGEYWVGLSAYLCLESAYDRNVVSNVVTSSYTQSIESATQAGTHESLSSWNEKWHAFMESKEYLKFKE